MATNARGDYENEPGYQQHAYAFLNHLMDESLPTDARWTSGPSLDGKGEFRVVEPAPALGQEPELQKAPPEVHAGADATAPGGIAAATRFTRVLGSAVDKVTPGSAACSGARARGRAPYARAMDFGVGYFPTHDGIGPGPLAAMVEERGQE